MKSCSSLSVIAKFHINTFNIYNKTQTYITTNSEKWVLSRCLLLTSSSVNYSSKAGVPIRKSTKALIGRKLTISWNNHFLKLNHRLVWARIDKKKVYLKSRRPNLAVSFYFFKNNTVCILSRNVLPGHTGNKLYNYC